MLQRCKLSPLSSSDLSRRAVSALFLFEFHAGDMGSHITSPFCATHYAFFLILLTILAFLIWTTFKNIDTLNISIWNLGPGPKGSTSIAFEARNGKGSLCLGEGRAYVVKKNVLPETDPNATAYDPIAAGQLQQPAHVANAPKLPKNPWNWLDSMFTFGGIPIRVVLTVVFFLPGIVLSTLQVVWTYVFGWWFLKW